MKTSKGTRNKNIVHAVFAILAGMVFYLLMADRNSFDNDGCNEFYEESPREYNPVTNCPNAAGPTYYTNTAPIGPYFDFDGGDYVAPKPFPCAKCSSLSNANEVAYYTGPELNWHTVSMPFSWVMCLALHRR
jgi:hypothetical protein